MSTDTVSALNNGGYQLYIFRAVSTDNQAARPLLWFDAAYSANTQIPPTDSYYAYTSSSNLQPGQQIFMGFNARIKMGQRLEVDKSGAGKVVQGRDGFISINNSSSNPFVAGLALGTVSSEVIPFFAEPLFGNQTNFVQPTSKILLVLSTQMLAPGTVVDAIPLHKEVARKIMVSQTSGILIEATSKRVVTFDINNGWSWGGAEWASLVNVSTDLTQTLIGSSAK